jgi:putative tributyrin esterase
MALLTMKFYSQVLGMNSSIQIIIPDMCIEDGKYPVLYALHGASENYTRWLRETAVERYANKYGIAVIIPETAQGYYTDMKDGYDYFTYISDEIPKIIKDTFPKITTEKKYTFIAGVDIGGYGAMKMLFSKDSAFSSAASISGILSIKKYMQYVKTNNYELLPRLINIWGNIEELDSEKIELIGIIKKITSEDQRLFLCWGNDDFTKDWNIEFLNFYNDKFNIESYEYEGNHSWESWSEQLEKLFEWLNEVVKISCNN